MRLFGCIVAPVTKKVVCLISPNAP